MLFLLEIKRTNVKTILKNEFDLINHINKIKVIVEFSSARNYLAGSLKILEITFGQGIIFYKVNLTAVLLNLIIQDYLRDKLILKEL